MTKQHGTLRNVNSGVEVEGTLNNLDRVLLNFHIDGTRRANTLLAGDWTFTPDPPKVEERYYLGSNGLIYLNHSGQVTCVDLRARGSAVRDSLHPLSDLSNERVFTYLGPIR